MLLEGLSMAEEQLWAWFFLQPFLGGPVWSSRLFQSLQWYGGNVQRQRGQNVSKCFCAWGRGVLLQLLKPFKLRDVCLIIPTGCRTLHHPPWCGSKPSGACLGVLALPGWGLWQLSWGSSNFLLLV